MHDQRAVYNNACTNITIYVAIYVAIYVNIYSCISVISSMVSLHTPLMALEILDSCVRMPLQVFCCLNIPFPQELVSSFCRSYNGTIWYISKLLFQTFACSVR